MTSAEKIHEDFAPEWEAYLQNMVLVFKEFYRKVVEEVTKETPVYFFRYEDQTIDARDTTLEFFRFMLD